MFTHTMPMRVARITIDFIRPVPIAPIEIKTEVVRNGRKIHLCEIRLSAFGADVVRAKVLKVRISPTDLPPGQYADPLDAIGVGEAQAPAGLPPIDSPFLRSVSMRIAKGDFARPGARAIWYRCIRPIVEGHSTSPLMRAAITADFGAGTGALLDPQHWSFVNSDISLNLLRVPAGEWILLDAASWIDVNGSGFSFARMADAYGFFAHSSQSLIIEKR
jgi:hypothetical protein